ncbi:hypothetical protein [Pseudomonas panipatensis]|uniref:Lipoprotein n=1 Tax=Pseudomonas panipatensis TaxID=428992 RepID=A0A1G8G900_9PSED|nr:hypothetical protein [Pseudomonas panipatensis]SDH90781.1 hypothetical protein SAMN05216272_10482 [Pseudomonas panipatensis]SMP44805.1 hypothetical protein SAMN06295951_101902 [Pseudomonas panipatensis]
MLCRFLPVALAALLLQGCGITMPRYESSYDNVQALRAKAPLATLDAPSVEADAGQNSIFVRANPVRSPEGDLSQHVQHALEGELRLAGLLEPGSPRHLDVRLRKTDLHAAAFGDGQGTLSADFDLRDKGVSLYHGSKQVSSRWDSSFFAVFAIPRAANAFNPLVRELLAELYQDPEFIQALKRP